MFFKNAQKNGHCNQRESDPVPLVAIQMRYGMVAGRGSIKIAFRYSPVELRKSVDNLSPDGGCERDVNSWRPPVLILGQRQ